MKRFSNVNVVCFSFDRHNCIIQMWTFATGVYDSQREYIAEWQINLMNATL